MGMGKRVGQGVTEEAGKAAAWSLVAMPQELGLRLHSSGSVEARVCGDWF